MCIPIHFLVALSLALGMGQEPPKSAEGEPFVVKKGRFVAVWKGDGKFLPARARELAFIPEAYSGPLKVVEVCKPGERVEQGEILIRFDPESIDEQIEKTRLDVKAAEQQVEDALARLRIAEMENASQMERAEMDLRHAELRLKGYREVEMALDAESRELSRMYQEHNIDDQKDELDQLGKMYEEDELTEETEELVLKRGLRDLNRALKSFALSRRRVEYGLEYNEGPRLERMVSEVESKKQNLQKMRLLGDSSVVTADIAVGRARMNLEKLEKTLEGLLEDRERMEMESPMDGLLLHGSRELKGGLLEKGKPAAANDPILTVAGEGSLEVRFELPEEDYFKLKEGMAATCKPTARPESPLSAGLHSIETLPGAQGKWECRAKIEGLHEEFLPGMTCKVEITYLNLPDVLTVPMEAVKKEDGREYCYKVTEEGVEKTAVKTGDSNEKEVIIEEGLEAGDRILLKEPEAAPPSGVKKMQVTDYGIRK